jgi:photosystem II stability/assembly factor-like uncharacterized protein
MNIQKVVPSILLIGLTAIALNANPVLTPGTWVNISPTQLSGACTDIQFDPGNRSTLWGVFGSADGIYRSTNGGSTWAKRGNMPSPVGLGRIRIDPRNSAHLYFAGGLGTVTNGFWASTDSGITWTLSAAFASGAANWTYDLYNMVMDPADGNHLILTSHQPWPGLGEDAGVLETKDGGATFIAHAPMSGMSHGQGIAFISDPAKGIGNGNTWLVGGGYAAGLYRTTDAGAHWSTVSSSYQDSHGGFQAYISKNGYIYVGGMGGIFHSTDNGITWSQGTTGVPYGWFYGIIGDGNHLYTSQAFVGVAQNAPAIVSPEGGANEGKTWTAYSTQTLGEGPWRMVYDSENGIIYSANWGSGAWALKVIDPVTDVKETNRAEKSAGIGLLKRNVSIIDGNRIRIRTSVGLSYDLKGKIISQSVITAISR